jgi:ubiquinone/menaquinone biosynthesis C-methylase UbiE
LIEEPRARKLIPGNRRDSPPESTTMPQPDPYLLGRAEPETARLRRQIDNLAADSEAQLETIGIVPGERVVDLGCGPGGVLHLLARRVGPDGSVLGVERSPHFVRLAREFVAEQGCSQVEVIEGDAYDTGLPRASFDGAHMRLVLVNVPEPERIVNEMVALVRPGGWVASFEADFTTQICDPPHPARDRLREAYAAHAAALGIDLSIGQRTHRMFRDVGVDDIRVDAIVPIYPPGHERRTILIDFLNNTRSTLISGGFIGAAEFEDNMQALGRHIADPRTLVASSMFYRVCGQVPA